MHPEIANITAPAPGPSRQTSLYGVLRIPEDIDWTTVDWHCVLQAMHAVLERRIAALIQRAQCNRT